MFIKVIPVGKPRMTRSDRWKQRPTVMRYWAYKDEVKKQWEKAGMPENFDGMFLSIYIPMPKSWSKKKKAKMCGKPHQQKPDIDNLAKAFLDAILDEDKQVYRFGAEKYWVYDEYAGIEVVI